MGRRLTTTVGPVLPPDADGDLGKGRTFGPGEQLPAWAEEHLLAQWGSEADIWAPEDRQTARPAPAAAEPPPTVEDEPPRGGPGSGKEAWAAYAAKLGVDVPEDASRDDIVALVDARQG